MDLFSTIYSSFLWAFTKSISSFVFLLVALANPGPGSDKRVHVFYSNFGGLHANLDELAVAGSEYDDLVCADSKVYDRLHLSEHRIPGIGCPQ